MRRVHFGDQLEDPSAAERRGGLRLLGEGAYLLRDQEGRNAKRHKASCT
jgi:hypothetical protein